MAFGGAEDQTWSAACKASALPAALSFWPLGRRLLLSALLASLKAPAWDLALADPILGSVGFLGSGTQEDLGGGAGFGGYEQCPLQVGPSVTKGLIRDQMREAPTIKLQVLPSGYCRLPPLCCIPALVVYLSPR